MTYIDYVKKVKALDKELFEYPYKDKSSFERDMARAVYATINGKMVGFYTIKSKPNKSICSLHAIGIEPKKQGKGLGKILLKDAINNAKDMGFQYMDLGVDKDEKAALHLYKKFGFKIVKKMKDRYIMKLNLKAASIHENIINELKLNYHISIRNIRGEKDDNVAACYGQNCKNMPDAKKRSLCKEKCQQTILNDAISKLGGVIAKCQYADYPSACRQAVARMIGVYRRRIDTSKRRESAIKTEIVAAKAIKRRK
jgi:ribosomal protein S18 acetylase RimI-like enzyme